MKKNFLFVIMLFLNLLLFSCTSEETAENSNESNIETVKTEASEESKENNINNPQNNEMRNNRGGGQGGIDKTNDEVLQNLIKTEVPKFKQFTYTDENSGITIEYNLFIPNNYDVNKKYPMVQFIPDASLFGKDTKSQLTQGYGGLVWTTDEAQSKNECFVYVPAFSSGLKKEYPSLDTRMDSVVDDDYNVSEDIFVNIDCIKDICKNYSIDIDRIYTTGQSMGGIMSFFYATYFNDVFAAYMPVGSQYDNSIVRYLTDVNLGNADIIYLVSEGDTKASEGMNELMSILDFDDTKYAFRKFSIKDTYENQNSIVNEALAEGKKLNLFMFNKGEVVPEGVVSNNEHMYSFDYAYKIDAAREYLFTKTKNKKSTNARTYIEEGIKYLNDKETYGNAYEFFLRATLLNDTKAPRYIGYMYENGFFKTKSDIQASIFYHIGTTRGDITSYYYLGRMYLDGKGVNQDTKRAEWYFEIAANSGNDDATGVKEAKVELEKLK